ncbi:hypothetical protein Acsp02_50170 [Actinoplanes sp. NBRC 103695]|nr:hypothetical protein Acsp02_50170 [Actinoplanes sp. NBRC 103695]
MLVLFLGVGGQSRARSLTICPTSVRAAAMQEGRRLDPEGKRLVRSERLACSHHVGGNVVVADELQKMQFH